MRKNQFRDGVAAHFRAHPGEWITAYALMEIGGVCAWRTRCSECRTQLGMAIENRTRKVGKLTVSEYRFTPASAPRQADLFRVAS